MHWYICKSLLNTVGRAVEQLAGFLAKQKQKSAVEVKVQQHALPAQRVKIYYEYRIARNFRGLKFSRIALQQIFRNLIFEDSIRMYVCPAHLKLVCA